MAGERALSLDVDAAERQLSRALELCPEGDSRRALLLERWAEAAHPQGRLQEAREALERALELDREQGNAVAAGRVLTRLSLILFRLGDPHSGEAIAEAVTLLEAQPPGPELVNAYAYAAGGHTLQNRPTEGIAAAEQALAVAAELGMPEPAFALHWFGVARSNLGDPGGIDDIRRALKLALEQSLGRETAVIYGNLASASWGYDGPRAALEAYSEAAAFCERRGLAEVNLHMRAEILYCRMELGAVTEEHVAEIGEIADQTQANGDRAFIFWRGLQLWLLVERGTLEHAPDPDEHVAAAREIGYPPTLVYAIANASRLHLAKNELAQAQALMRELDELTNVAARVDVTMQPATVLRVALGLGNLPLAKRLVADAEASATTRFDQHSLVAAKAQLAEAEGGHVAAATLYRDAVERWREFGNVPERAYALLGRGRCLRILADPGADEPLAEASELFASMGYGPALTETEALLAESQPAAS